MQLWQQLQPWVCVDRSISSEHVDTAILPVLFVKLLKLCQTAWGSEVKSLPSPTTYSQLNWKQLIDIDVFVLSCSVFASGYFLAGIQSRRFPRRLHQLFLPSLCIYLTSQALQIQEYLYNHQFEMSWMLTGDLCLTNHVTCETNWLH